MTRPTTPPVASPPPGVALLLGLMDAGIDEDLWGLALDQVSAAGPLDWSSPVNEQGDPLLLALVRANPNLHPDTLKLCLAASGPEALVRANPKGVTVVSLLLDRQFDEGSVPKALPLLLTLAPFEALARWSKVPRWEEGKKASAPGVALLAGLLAHDMKTFRYEPSRKTSEASLTDLWLARGMTMNATRSSGNPLVLEASCPSHWDAYLRDGGQPTALVNTAHSDERPVLTPVWKATMDRAPKPLAQHIEQWAKANVSNELEAQVQSAYWQQFDRYLNAADIGKKLRNHPDWASLRDASGRTPIMAAAVKHPSAFREFKSKKAEPLLALRDDQGRTVWNHLMGHQNAFSQEAIAFYLEHVPTEPGPSGRGWLVQLALDKADDASSVQSVLPLEDQAKVLLRHVGWEPWFAGTDEELTGLATWLAQAVYQPGGSATKTCATLCTVLTHYVQNAPDPHPDLRASAMLYAWAWGERADAEATVAAWLAGGRWFDETTKLAQRAFKSRSAEDPLLQSVWTKNLALAQAKDLQRSVPHTGSSPRTSVRL